MKPKNRSERLVVECQAKLGPVSQSQYEEAKHMSCDIIQHEDSYWCSKCGWSWTSVSRSKNRTCPHCRNSSKPVSNGVRKRVLNEKYYYATMTVVEDYQVVRTFLCDRKSKKGTGVSYFEMSEVFQLWFKPGGDKIVFGRRTSPCSMFVDAWSFSQPMEIRSWHYRYNIEGYLSRRVKLHPMVKRNGLTKIRKGISYVDQVYGVMNDPRCEILAKSKQWSMLREICSGRRYDNDLWPSVRIAIRHGYLIEDAGLWIDMVSMLKKCGKDIHNPKYICPSSLRDGHDFAQRLNDRRIEKERQEEMRREMEDLVRRLKEDSREQEEYKRRVEKWIGKKIVCGEIVISPLKDIFDFKKEGDALHHCVFSNGYYEREDCLILGARVNGKRTETIEIGTERWNIVQCRGNHNQPSIYHEQILDAVRSNLGVFRHAQ